ncbi:hypothetical protein J6590_055316 [Homalodisca vitripennis]|nr:hypothetical protein J6590_055316 [Homalodisca vitripennis]
MIAVKFKSSNDRPVARKQRVAVRRSSGDTAFRTDPAREPDSQVYGALKALATELLPVFVLGMRRALSNLRHKFDIQFMLL